MATASRESCRTTAGTRICSPSRRNCSIAAGRCTSAPTSMGRRPISCNLPASLAAEVVLPEPCRPTRRNVAGDCPFRSSGVFCEPMSAVNSSRTILTTCWPGVRLRMTSWPSACSRTRCTKSFTTWKLTSASRSASRISRVAVLTSDSVSLPRPRRREKMPSSFAERESNMACPGDSNRARDAGAWRNYYAIRSIRQVSPRP